MKYSLYAKDKVKEVEKYKEKMQAKYDSIRTSKAPWLICCPVMTYEGKFAVPLAIEGYPGNDGDDGVVDHINPPIAEQMPEE